MSFKHIFLDFMWKRSHSLSTKNEASLDSIINGSDKMEGILMGAFGHVFEKEQFLRKVNILFVGNF